MPAKHHDTTRLAARLARVVNLERHELPALVWAFLYFFSLLSSYYIVRPMRDEMGVAGGVENLQWLFTGTLVVMLAAVPLFGWVSSRFERSRLLPCVYYFFILNLAAFFVLFHSGVTHAWVARGFFIWASVFNLFVVSVFWSFMADIFSNEQARRLFAVIAAGGTLGAISGPLITASLALPLGPVNLLPVSAGFLGMAVLCIHRLRRWASLQGAKGGAVPAAGQALGGSPLAGIRLVMGSPYLLGICVLMLLFTSLATFLYFLQAEIIRDHFPDPGRRTAVFAGIDLAVNCLTLVFQILLTGRLVQWLGLEITLALIPVLLGLGFIALGVAPVLTVLVVVQVLRRAGNYAIMRPAREMLYVVLGREEKYKAKNFIDTVVYRGGDALSAWAFAGLRALGLGLSAIAFIAVPLAGLWAWVAWRMGQAQTRTAREREPAARV